MRSSIRAPLFSRSYNCALLSHVSENVFLVNPAGTNLLRNPIIRCKYRSACNIKTSKRFYNTSIQFRCLAVSSQIKWNERFRIGEAESETFWQSVYRSPYHAARDTKLQAFQFRLTHRIILCNKFLCNIKIRQNDECSFCGDTDTLEHYFFLCDRVALCWERIRKWFAENANFNLDTSLQDFLFGAHLSTPNASVINFILLFSKFYIYGQKLFQQGELHLIPFINELCGRLQAERYIDLRPGGQATQIQPLEESPLCYELKSIFSLSPNSIPGPCLSDSFHSQCIPNIL